MVAIVAVFQTQKQIKLSNKQHLFDERIESYLIVEGMIELYRVNCENFEKDKDKVLFAVDLYFMWLTNNIYLESISKVIYNPLEPAIHKQFLTKLENLKEVSLKIELLFSDEESDLLRDFAVYYQKLLFNMYQYKIVRDNMKKHNEENIFGKKLPLEEIQKIYKEAEQRKKLISSFDKLKEIDEKLEKIDYRSKIKRQIKLK